MTQHVPISLVLTPSQIAWLDAERQHGNISRSAALRQALDRLISQQQAAPTAAGISNGR